MDLPDKQAAIPEPTKDIKAVVTGAKKVNRPATRRFMDFLFAESPKALVGKIGRDVMVPRLKAGFEEALGSFVSGMLWGDGQRPVSTMLKGAMIRGGGVNYSAASTGTPMGMLQARQANQSRSSGNYQDLILPTQQSAEVLLGNMYELLNQYRVVMVADLYELAEISPQPSDNAYGWTSLDGARIMKERDGFRLELPRPSLI